MNQWLIFLALVHNGLAIGLYDEIDDLWRRGEPSESTSRDKECIRDILVIWDNSQSVGIGNFKENVRPFLKDLIEDPKLNVGKDGSHIGFITFASDDKTYELLKIGSKTSKKDLETWLDGLDYKRDLMGPFTYTGKAFKLASDEFHLKNPLNHRKDIDDVVLLFTDGEPRARKKEWIKEQKKMAEKYSAALMARNVSIVALAVGQEADKPEFQKNIDSWSSYMFTSGFKDLNKILDKIVKKSCGIKPLDCSCDGKISTEQYTKPGESSILLPWKEPKLKCDKPVDQQKTVTPASTRNPQRFGVGSHRIKYTFTYNDSNNKKVSRDCFVNIKVGACKCPSSQRVSARVKIGQTKASVSWVEPVPTCPRLTPCLSNPKNAGGQFPVGEFTRTYKYTHTTEFQSFEIRCDVNIVVAGDYCGRTAYDPATHICCCGKPHRKKSGYKCCGKNYYNPANFICCQDTSLVNVRGHCPF